MIRKILASAFILLFPVAALAFTVPPNDGYVTDAAGVLTQQQIQDLSQRIDAYRKQTSNEIAILLVKNLGGEPVADVGVQAGRAWKVGSTRNNGILILASMEDREMTVQAGYGLEGAVPDIVAKGIIENDIRPKFRDGKYYEGLLAGLDALQKHIGGEYTADRYAAPQGSGIGAGFFVFVLIMLNVLGSILGQSKSWWLGGVIGAVFGIILTVIYSWWISIPVFVGLGLLFDYIVSRNAGKNRGGRWRGGGGWGGGGGSGGSSGGFGGFGGGSFGGGGASGKW